VLSDKVFRFIQQTYLKLLDYCSQKTADNPNFPSDKLERAIIG